MGPRPREFTAVTGRGRAEEATSGKLGGPPAGVDVPLGIRCWAECAQWKGTEGVSRDFSIYPNLVDCGLFTSEMNEAGEAVWRWGGCLESQAEELGLYLWVMAEGWVSREGLGAGM